MTAPRYYRVIYRTGGLICPCWHDIFTRFADRATASAKLAELKRMGYDGLIEDWDHSYAIGLPE